MSHTHRSTQYISSKLSHAFTHLEPPKHHRRAKRLLTDLIKVLPDTQTILFDMGIVLQHENKWKEAADYIQRVLALADTPEIMKMKAKGELAWCNVNMQNYDDGQAGLKEVILYWQDNSENNTGDDVGKLLSVLWWRIGQCQWRKGGKLSLSYSIKISFVQ